MRTTICSFLVALTCSLPEPIDAQDRGGAGDLQGVWASGTMTPLERPPEFADKPTLSPAEAAAYEAGHWERILGTLATPEDRLLQIDFNDDYAHVNTLDRFRTGLIIDPPTGRLPPGVPSGRRPVRGRQSLDDPEGLTLTERCLGGFVPHTGFGPTPGLLRIVQTAAGIAIASEA